MLIYLARPFSSSGDSGPTSISNLACKLAWVVLLYFNPRTRMKIPYPIVVKRWLTFPEWNRWAAVVK